MLDLVSSTAPNLDMLRMIIASQKTYRGLSNHSGMLQFENNVPGEVLVWSAAELPSGRALCWAA